MFEVILLFFLFFPVFPACGRFPAVQKLLMKNALFLIPTIFKTGQSGLMSGF